MRLRQMDYKVMTNFLNGFQNVTHNGNVILTADNFRYVLRRYVNWTFIKYDEEVEDVEYLNQLWNEFFTLYKDQYFKMIDVMVSEYDPISNYDKNSKITYSQVNENLNETNGATTTSGDTTTESFGFNSNGFSNNNKVLTNTSIGQQNNTSNKTISEHTTTEITKGNIGVTSTQDMMKQELEIRQKNINEWLITTFCRQNLIHC